ncbi:MAG: Na+/H+ antiporter NhaA, partial [Deltaproteobacteria bacterium]|nr:Na+/H+ antiporter NhaA [Deltaproteobacteria bacterium]
MKLVVGLGNPGPQYADTRHNVGFRVVEHMAEALGLAFSARPDGRLVQGTLPGEDGGEVAFALLEPGTFMNRSGGPVSAALTELGITDPARDLLVVYDDLDLPTARLRVRKKGGAGGHNGLGDILTALDTRDVPRIRFGVGRPPEGVDAVDHVLAPFDRAEEAAIDAGVAEAAEAARAFVTDGIDVAMNRFNSSPREPAAADAGGRKSEGQPVQSPAAAPAQQPLAALAKPPPAQEPTRSPQPAMPEAPQPLAQRIARPFVQFMRLEIASALVLLAMTALALVWANSPFAESYEHLLHEPIAFALGSHALSLSVHHWINDGLMAIFFFLVGMEIKREMVLGDLSTRARAMLPVMGALGGMLLPAGIYAAMHWGGPAIGGWGIPMATDIAFAVAAMSVLGSRVPAPLKVFLLALAIADDLGAVLVIAVFYTDTIHLAALGWAAASLAVVYAMNMSGVRSFQAYWVVGAVAWFFTHESGVHATIAGVLLGLMTPAYPDPERQGSLLPRSHVALDHLRDWISRDEEDKGGHNRHHAVVSLQNATRDSLSPLDYLTNRLERPVLFLIMPLFALANAGVAIEASTFSDPTATRVALAVALGLLVGKPIGITLLSWGAVRIGL